MDSKTLKKLQMARLFTVFKESRISIMASTLCAIIIVIAYGNLKNPSILYGWFFVFLIVNSIRYFFALKHGSSNSKKTYEKTPYIIFVVGTTLAGLGWGTTSFLLFPFGDQYQRILLILVLAGITAGATTSLSALIEAAVIFLLLTILPFIVVISTSKIFVFILYDITLTAYLIYLIVLSFQSRRRITDIFLLQFEKDDLLKELSKTNKKLKKLATHDFLTELDNAMLFDSKLSEAIVRAKRNQKMLAVMFIDIDKFKQVNDTLGHDAGNELLVKTTQLLKNGLRHTDTLARLGGDEFAVILEDIYNQESIRMIAEKICQKMAQAIEIKGTYIKASVSIGISIYPLDADQPTTLVNLADAAMYKIKNHGGGGFHFSD